MPAKRKAGHSSKPANKLIAKIKKLGVRARRIVAQAEKLAADAKLAKNIVTQAATIAAEARRMADDARPSKKLAAELRSGAYGQMAR